MFHENGDGFDMVRGKNFGHVAWETVRKVIERPRYFQFVLNKYDSIIIPKRFLFNGSDEKLLKEIISFQVGSKAKLLR
jgi:YcxB-like protein